MVRPLKSVTHGQCDARPTVTFLAVEHRRPLTRTKLYRLVTGAQRCEQLAQSRYAAAPQRGVEPVTSSSQCRHSTRCAGDQTLGQQTSQWL